MYFAHLGDSRIYYLPQEGGIRQVTHDHSYVGWLRRKGELNERQAREHPGRNTLNQALGAGHQFIEPHIGAVGHLPGDRFLICSDGLTDGLWDHQIEERLRNPSAAHAEETPARRLVDDAVQASGRDNTTALVIELPEPANPAPVNPPSMP
jgi:protein phosphatase